MNRFLMQTMCLKNLTTMNKIYTTNYQLTFNKQKEIRYAV